MEYMLRHITDMDTAAERELAHIEEEVTAEMQGATVVALSGELGAGKTVFVKALGRRLGITENIPSPTFVIARFYTIPKHRRFRRLVHIDAYRIESEEELRPLGWDKILADAGNLVLIEWPERIPMSIGTPLRTLRFTVVDETTRLIRA